MKTQTEIEDHSKSVSVLRVLIFVHNCCVTFCDVRTPWPSFMRMARDCLTAGLEEIEDRDNADDLRDHSRDKKQK